MAAGQSLGSGGLLTKNIMIGRNIASRGENNIVLNKFMLGIMP